jgi:hypothetical protein
MTSKSVYVNTTIASAVFVVFLTFGFIWASFYTDAPFTAYMEGLILALGFITGKRLWQKWQGKTKTFKSDATTAKESKKKPACAEDDDIEIR